LAKKGNQSPKKRIRAKKFLEKNVGKWSIKLLNTITKIIQNLIILEMVK
jgi:hypothetical protein